MAGSLQCPNCGANVLADDVRCSFCQSVLARTACPICLGPIFRGMKFCPDCGSRVSRQDLILDSSLHCPRCESHLMPALIADVRVDECDQCGGVWLDRQAFQEICEHWDTTSIPLAKPESGPGWTSAASQASVATESSHSRPVTRLERMYVPCPACGELMLRRNFAGCSGVIIDWCKPHGYWFDRAELQQVVSFIRTGGMQKAREKELQGLREEQDRLRALQSQSLPGSVDPRVDSAAEFFGLETDWIETITSIIKKLFD